MYSTSSGRGFLPLVTAAHEISPTCSELVTIANKICFSTRQPFIADPCLHSCPTEFENTRSVYFSVEHCFCERSYVLWLGLFVKYKM